MNHVVEEKNGSPVAQPESSMIEKTAPYAWVILLVTWFASFTAPMSQFKVIAIFEWMTPVYNMDQTMFGLLMSALAIIGVILAFPSAFIVGKWGPKQSVLIALAFLLVGNLIGVFSQTFPVLMFSRMLEGFGIGLMGVVAPSAIGIWFPQSKRGLPLGIWSSWVPVCTVVMLNIAPRMAGSIGFRSVWWLCIAFTVVMIILFAIFYKLPEGVDRSALALNGTLKEGLNLFKGRDIWMVVLAFFTFHVVGLIVVNTFYPNFLTAPAGATPWSGWGLDSGTAGFICSVCTIICIFLNPLFGFLYDKLRAPKIIITCGLLCLTAACFLCWNLDNFACVWATIILTALGIGSIAGCCRALAPEILMKKNPVMAVPMGQALLAFAQNLCSCVVAVIFGAIVDGAGWAATNYFMIPFHIIVIILFVAFFRAKKYNLK